MFSEKEKLEFKPFVKKRFETSLPIMDAIISAYLDVCRVPLKGINTIINAHNPNFTSIKVRDKFIEEVFIPSIDELARCDKDYDKWHFQLCNSLIEFYKTFGYYDMTYGKAQKWINMSLKYIMLYTEEYQQNLIKYQYSFHVPIDRYVAPSIAGLIGFLPSDGDGRNLTNLDKSFDSEKENYSWSKISNYNDYLKCQTAIRSSLTVPPLKWEYNEWQKERISR